MSCIHNALLVCLLSGTGAFGAVNRLDAIGMIESGDNDRAIGKAGEISRYQIKPQIWKSYSVSSAWKDVTVSRPVAQRYLETLETRFRNKVGREPSDFDVYVLWNAGPNYYEKVGFSPKKVAPVVRERAQRYVNIRQMPDATPAFPTTLTSLGAPGAFLHTPPLAAAGFSFTAVRH